MKQSFKSGAVLVLCIFFILFSSTLSTRLLANKEGQEKELLNEMAHGGSLVGLEGSELMDQLMGVEDCVDGDEDCSKRRIMAEAHLDYIYTQKHKP
ncbi:putative phytosulfokines 6 [Pyrus communis]|uniref:putative phytosulfokines 6 n=1 Tax=Pyrus communis TaxID=23211 RepID=UPI000511584D